MTDSNENGPIDTPEPETEASATETEERDPLAELQAERDRAKDQLLRTAADFDNFRKRARRELEDAKRRGREEVLSEILPVIDNLERAVSAAQSAKDVAAVADGVKMVLKYFEDVASRLSLERVQAIGERFDPNVHDAVQQQETDEHPPGTVVAEIVPGYVLGGKLLRPATVVVAKPTSPDEG